MAKFNELEQPTKKKRGRPFGAESKATKLLKKESLAVLMVAIQQAKAGDVAAQKLVLDRTIAKLRPEAAPIKIKFPSDATLTDKANLILDGALTGKIDPLVAISLLNSITMLTNLSELDELMAIVEQLQTQIKKLKWNQ